MQMQALFDTVTQRIIRELENGAIPWLKPWKDSKAIGGLNCLPYNHLTNRSYSGINVLQLWGRAEEAGYKTPRWLTFQQANESGYKVRKGEKATPVVFANVKEYDDETAPGEKVKRMFLRAYYVFNIDQCDGVPPSFYEPEEPRSAGAATCELNEIIRLAPISVKDGGSRACFSPQLDMVSIPKQATFQSSEHFYATLAHECIHWSGHKTRLDREFGKRFGDDAYAFEELVAEMGCAFLCATLGITGDLRHAGYIEHWLKVLKGDNKAIFTAASRASQAARYLLNFHPKYREERDTGQKEAA